MDAPRRIDEPNMPENSQRPDLGAKSDRSRLQVVAMRLARRCRYIVQGCLREDEWADCDAEFATVILEELQQLGLAKEE